MNDWRTALRDADPGEHAQLPASDVQAMRRAVLAATVGRAPAAPRLWVQPLLVAATIALMIGTGVMAGRKAAVTESRSPIHTTTTDPGDQEKRQLQFATPGGTRIIWVFNPEFQVSESTP
jgi:hypothetical protein